MSTQEPSRTLDLKDVLGVISKRRWAIAIPFLIVIGLAWGGSFLLTREYEASAIVSYHNDPNLIKPLSGLVPTEDYERMSNDDRRRLLAAMQNEIVSSRALSRLIMDLKLADDPDIQEQARRIKSRSPERDEQDIRLEILFEKLRASIVVYFAGKDQLFISILDPVPQMAQSKAARLVDIFIEERVLRDLGSVREAQELTDDQIGKYDKQLQAAIDERNATEREYLRLQVDESIVNDENRRTISAAIDEIRSEVTDLEKDMTRAGGKIRALSATEETFNAAGGMDSIRAELFEDSKFLVDLMGKYPWSDRIVLNGTIELNRNVVRMETIVADAVARQFASRPIEERTNLGKYFFLQERIRFLKSHQGQLQSSFNKVLRQAQAIPEAKSRLEQKEKDVVAAQNTRDLFKQQETSNQLQQEVIHSANSRYRIVEPPRVPIEPAKPDRVKITIMGAILGVVLGAAAALFAEIVDVSFKRVQDVERELALPVLGTIPKIEGA